MVCQSGTAMLTSSALARRSVQRSALGRGSSRRRGSGLRLVLPVMIEDAHTRQNQDDDRAKRAVEQRGESDRYAANHQHRAEQRSKDDQSPIEEAPKDQSYHRAGNQRQDPVEDAGGHAEQAQEGQRQA